MAQSTDFGRGYATCLIQFVWHEPRLTDERDWKSQTDVYREIGDKGRAESRFVELWANGSSDHLYDLITGGRVPPLARAQARAVAGQAIRCGHGFTGESWSRSEALGWITTARQLLRDVGDPQTLEEAMEIDRRLGLNPQLGDAASCSGPIPPFSAMR